MGKGKDGCTSGTKRARQFNAASMAVEERRQVAPASEVDRILEKMAISGAAKRMRRQRRATETSEDLYNRMVDESLVLPRDDERKLLIIAKTHPSQEEREKARQALVLCNQRWIIKSAHSPEWRGRGVSVQELIDAANSGLLHAIEKFDLSKPNSFVTYAKHWIRMYQQRMTEKESSRIYGARLPSDVYNEVGRVRRALAQAADKHHDPTADELAQITNLSEAKVQRALDILRNRPISQQQRLGTDDDSDLEFGDTLVASEPTPLEQIISQERSEALDRAFEQLTPQERLVMGVTLGYGAYEQAGSVKEIVSKYGMKANVVSKLRTSGYAKLQAALTGAGFAPAAA